MKMDYKVLLKRSILCALMASMPIMIQQTVSAAAGHDTSVVNATTASSEAVPTTAITSEKKIMINLASRLLTLYQGNTKIRMYSVGVGKLDTPSPVGYYSIQEKEVNPTWINPEDKEHPVKSGPDNPLGYRWLGFNGTYGIHGTNSPSSIGRYVSHGCIRLHEADIEDLYAHTPLGTPVVVYYDRIVIDSAPDHTVSYYIYPDGYNRQPLTIAGVKKALAGYGVENFESDEAISEKILSSDGEPTYIAKAYDLTLDGQKLGLRALGKNGQIYLPAQVIATAENLDMKWDPSAQTITTKNGSGTAYAKSNVLYIPANELQTLFKLDGSLSSNLVYEMTSPQQEIPVINNGEDVDADSASPETTDITATEQNNTKEATGVKTENTEKGVNKTNNKVNTKTVTQTNTQTSNTKSTIEDSVASLRKI